MPTVGCEVEAVAHTTEESLIFDDLEQIMPLFSMAPAGSYVDQGRLEGKLPNGSEKGKVEVVFAGDEERWRVVVVFAANVAGGGLDSPDDVHEVQVHKELYDRAYDGGCELAGCGGGLGDIGGKEVIDAGKLRGSWRVEEGWQVERGGDGVILRDNVVAYVDD